jgi:hypothetical protein
MRIMRKNRSRNLSQNLSRNLKTMMTLLSIGILKKMSMRIMRRFSTLKTVYLI